MFLINFGFLPFDVMLDEQLLSIGCRPMAIGAHLQATPDLASEGSSVPAHTTPFWSQIFPCTLVRHSAPFSRHPAPLCLPTLPDGPCSFLLEHQCAVPCGPSYTLPKLQF